ncbi:MAG: hypothetical protein JXR56_04065, partial [Candidatus Cloacimonetes bacterium]|nr:hypothetical protein [Candidatus Cloacimonadota bacterium]
MKNYKWIIIFVMAICWVTLKSIPAPDNNCLDFNGFGDYVQLDNENAYDFTNYLTVEFWVKVDSWLFPWAALVTKGDSSWRVHRYNATDFIRFETGNVYVTTTTEFNDNEWHHIVCEKYGASIYIYVDGVREDFVINSPTLAANSYPVCIGENYEQRGRYFDGQIDDVRIWNSSIYRTEYSTNPNVIWEHIHTPPTGGGLVAYYSMNTANGSILTNSTGTNHGTIYGATYTSSPTPVGVNWYGGTYSDLTLDYDVSKIWSDLSISSNLTVNPGVTVEMQGDFRINMISSAEFNAVGTETDSILFTVVDTTGYATGTGGCWKGIRLDGSLYNGSNTIEHCIFEYGLASGLDGNPSYGGVIEFDAYAPAEIKNSLFRYNTASEHGGAIYMLETGMTTGTGSAVIENCTFKNNTAGDNGGAIYSSGKGLTIRGCRFEGNEATLGGAVYISTGAFFQTLFQNNIVVGNVADNGGGLYITQSNMDNWNNNLILDNTAEYGGGIYVADNSDTIIRNSIIRGNNATNGEQIYIYNTDSDPAFEYCIIEGGFDGFAGSGAESYTGSMLFCYDKDPLFLGTGGHPYALSDYSPCINAGKPGTTAGDYDLAGNPRIFISSADTGYLLHQGFNNIDIGPYEYQQDTGTIAYDLTVNEAVTLNHDILIPVGTTVTFRSVILYDADVSITVVGNLNTSGASIRRYFNTPTESGIVFVGNSGSSLIANTSFTRNEPQSGVEKGWFIFVNGYDGLRIENSWFNGGMADQGGAIYFKDCVSEIYGSLLLGNEASVSGGGIYCENSDVTLSNLTISNSIGTYSAIEADSQSEVYLFSSIVWGNADNPLSNSLIAYYSDIQGGYISGTGIIDEDPQFLSITGENKYKLKSTSPCINRGMPDVSQLNLPTYDYFGNPRIHQHQISLYNRIDMGISEYEGLLAPANFSASDGDNSYPGYVYMTWEYRNTYQPLNGFQIYRDGIMINSVLPQSNSYSDYEAIPGVTHTYGVVAYAGYESSAILEDTGFVLPNGIITGTITTPNNNPVANVTVSLTPSSGYCIELDAAEDEFGTFVPEFTGTEYTLETWIKTSSSDCSVLYLVDADTVAFTF